MREYLNEILFEINMLCILDALGINLSSTGNEK